MLEIVQCVATCPDDLVGLINHFAQFVAFLAYSLHLLPDLSDHNGSRLLHACSAHLSLPSFANPTAWGGLVRQVQNKPGCEIDKQTLPCIAV